MELSKKLKSNGGALLKLCLAFVLAVGLMPIWGMQQAFADEEYDAAIAIEKCGYIPDGQTANAYLSNLLKKAPDDADAVKDCGSGDTQIFYVLLSNAVGEHKYMVNVTVGGVTYALYAGAGERNVTDKTTLLYWSLLESQKMVDFVDSGDGFGKTANMGATIQSGDRASVSISEVTATLSKDSNGKTVLPSSYAEYKVSDPIAYGNIECEYSVEVAGSGFVADVSNDALKTEIAAPLQKVRWTGASVDLTDAADLSFWAVLDNLTVGKTYTCSFKVGDQTYAWEQVASKSNMWTTLSVLNGHTGNGTQGDNVDRFTEFPGKEAQTDTVPTLLDGSNVSFTVTEKDGTDKAQGKDFKLSGISDIKSIKASGFNALGSAANAAIEAERKFGSQVYDSGANTIWAVLNNQDAHTSNNINKFVLAEECSTETDGETVLEPNGIGTYTKFYYTNKKYDPQNGAQPTENESWAKDTKIQFKLYAVNGDVKVLIDEGDPIELVELKIDPNGGSLVIEESKDADGNVYPGSVPSTIANGVNSGTILAQKYKSVESLGISASKTTGTGDTATTTAVKHWTGSDENTTGNIVTEVKASGSLYAQYESASNPSADEPSVSASSGKVTDETGAIVGTTTTVENEDGTTTVTTAYTAGDNAGITVTETKSADGATTSTEVEISSGAAAYAEEAIALPIEAVEANSATAVTVKADTGTSVVVPVAKAEGQKTVSDGTVLVAVDANGNETVIAKSIATEDGVLFAMPDDAVTVRVKEVSADLPDIQGNEWYANGVADFAVSRGIIEGVTMEDGTKQFQGDASLTRGMFATVLHRLESTPAAEVAADFSDVDANEWYGASVAWAKEKGIVTGYGDTGVFGPNDFMTREQMATMMMRYANLLGLDTTGRADLSGYSDAGQISDYATDAMQWAVHVGLMKGYDGTDQLGADQGATRAEMCVVIQRLVNLVLA